jgi:uncharacterized lipoprotein YajG
MRASKRTTPARATALLLIAASMALAGCQTDDPGASMAAGPVPMTRQNAALICWSKTEKDAARMTLDKRADVVTKCIDDKMRSARN